MAEFYKIVYIEAHRAADGKWLITDEDDNTITIEHDEFRRTYIPVDGAMCEVCENHIDTDNDVYYAWADSIYTCKICGGADENHKPYSFQNDTRTYEV